MTGCTGKARETPMPENPYQPPIAPDALQEQELPDDQPLTLDNETAGPVMFGVSVRTIGLLLIIYGLYWVFYGFLLAAGIGQVNAAPIEYAIAAALYFAIGVGLLRGASVVVSIAYPDGARKAD